MRSQTSLLLLLLLLLHTLVGRTQAQAAYTKDKEAFKYNLNCIETDTKPRKVRRRRRCSGGLAGGGLGAEMLMEGIFSTSHCGFPSALVADAVLHLQRQGLLRAGPRRQLYPAAAGAAEYGERDNEANTTHDGFASLSQTRARPACPERTSASTPWPSSTVCPAIPASRRWRG